MTSPDPGQQSAAMHAHLEQVAEHGALDAARAERADAIASLVTQTRELIKVQAQVRRVQAIVDDPRASVPVTRVRAARIRAALEDPT